MKEIREVTYAESRLDYFRRRAEKCRKSLWWWQWQKPNKQYSQITIRDMCNEIGREISYLDDVIEMLEKAGVEG